MDLEFRNCLATEVSAEIVQVNKGGVKLLLWKKPLCSNHILDEAVGPLGWSAHIVEIREGFARVQLKIYDKNTNQWIEREGVSDKPTVKGAFTDALNFAASQFGVGSELYTGPELFIPKEMLQNYVVDEETGEPTCTDVFSVTDIQYTAGKNISSVTIMVRDHINSAGYLKKVFTATPLTTTNGAPATPAAAPSGTPATDNVPNELADDDVILIGYNTGKMYKEVKGTPQFSRFLDWAAKTDSQYHDPEKTAQLAILKKMAASRNVG